MGHLVNPVGFHVGHLNNWSDIWSVSHNSIYAELLHNTLEYRKILSLYFENFTTDRYSILYSHFTVEVIGLNTNVLKMYFYDGIVEQQFTHMSQQLKLFEKAQRRVYRKFLFRKFKKIKKQRSVRSEYLAM